MTTYFNNGVEGIRISSSADDFGDLRNKRGIRASHDYSQELLEKHRELAAEIALKTEVAAKMHRAVLITVLRDHLTKFDELEDLINEFDELTQKLKEDGILTLADADDEEGDDE